MKPLHKRIFDISYKYKLSHIGSCITAVDIIDEIYSIKKPDEPFILSSGHAGLALYCVIEKYGGRNAEDIWRHHGTHPDRCIGCRIDCSTGSLGQGLPIAVGMALADRKKNVYCLISDGECAEGSIWEALRIAKEQRLDNLKIHINWNGYAAYQETDLKDFMARSSGWAPNRDTKIHRNDMYLSDYPFLKVQDAHYYTMTDQDYQWCGTDKVDDSALGTASIAGSSMPFKLTQI